MRPDQESPRAAPGPPWPLHTGDHVHVLSGEYAGRAGTVYGFASDNRVGVDFDRLPSGLRLAAYIWVDHVAPTETTCPT